MNLGRTDLPAKILDWFSQTGIHLRKFGFHFLKAALAAVVWTALVFRAGAQPSTLPAPTGPIIKAIEIRHTGPPGASEALIRANIRLQVGDTYNPNGVNDDVRTLYSTGLFYNVQVREEPLPGGIKLIYLLQKKPTVTDIRFQGNKKYSDQKLRGKLTSKVGQPLDEHKLFLDAQEIQKKYQKAGYQKTEVKPVVSSDENAGTAVATFDVKEAPKVL